MTHSHENLWLHTTMLCDGCASNYTCSINSPWAMICIYVERTYHMRCIASQLALVGHMWAAKTYIYIYNIYRYCTNVQ